MSKAEFMDCYYTFNGNFLVLGNSNIERKIGFYGKYPVSDYIMNKLTGHCWSGNSESRTALFNVPVLDFEKASVDVTHYINNNGGLSKNHLVVDMFFMTYSNLVKLQFSIFPEQPFITSKLFVKGRSLTNSGEQNCRAEGDKFNGIETSYSLKDNSSLALPLEDSTDAFNINERHLKLKVIKLFDRTDLNDYLVKESSEALYSRAQSSFEGNMFLIDNYLKDEALLLVKEGPTAAASLNRKNNELYIKPVHDLQFVGTGIDYSTINHDELVPAYGCTIGIGSSEKLQQLYKSFYNSLYTGDVSGSLFIMSNTWGDRNQDAAVCHDFIMKEINSAAEIGTDIVQIDDGWQKGITANSKLAKGGVWEGYYASDPDFWQVNKNKFPFGLKPVVDYAAERGIKLGLWFSPDSSRDFANWQKDAETLLELYKQYNICYFKLDGIKIRSKQCEINLIKFLDMVSRESNNKVTFNSDVTAETRFGYLYEKQYGTIFVENRYTDWANYYPHSTLKNLWQLSGVIPSRKLLFEVLNNKRNISKYEGDPLAPSNYTIDYEFASVMTANPLLWMEMSNLTEEDRKRLAGIASVYKEHRQNIFHGEVLPVGDMPDGAAFTGFQVKCSYVEGYLILFREFTNEDNHSFKLQDISSCRLNLEYIYSNFPSEEYALDCEVNEDGYLKVGFNKARSFVFIKYKKI